MSQKYLTGQYETKHSDVPSHRCGCMHSNGVTFLENIGGSKHTNPVILPLKMPATITNHILGGIVW